MSHVVYLFMGCLMSIFVYKVLHGLFLVCEKDNDGGELGIKLTGVQDRWAYHPSGAPDFEIFAAGLSHLGQLMTVFSCVL